MNPEQRTGGGLRRRLPRLAAGTAVGVVAAGFALGVGETVAVAVGPYSAPVTAVGSAVIDLTPHQLKDFAIREFGTQDKFVLLTSVYSVLALFAAAAGVLALRHRRSGAVAVGALGLVGVAAALSRPTSSASYALPSLAAMVAGGAALWFLIRFVVVRPVESMPSFDRRRFLVALGGTAAVASAAGAGGRALSRKRFNVEAVRESLRFPAPRVPAAPVPVDAQVRGLAPFITPNKDFYRVDTALVLPQVDPRDWTLRIHGLVDRPVEITYDELIGMPLVEQTTTISCVSNEVGGPYAGTATWLGVPLATLLRRAGLRPGADQLVGRGAEGTTIGTPLDLALDGRAGLLAVAMGGEPLPITHGFPCRMLVPGLYGYTSATKWLVDLNVTRFDKVDAYWVERGWDRLGVMKTQSRIEIPRPFAQVKAGPVTVAGTAWVTGRGISAVQVRVDKGPWQNASLAASAGPDSWRQWSWQWPASAGQHRLEVRAADGPGDFQVESRTPPFPSGATGWHSTVVTVT